MILMVKKLLDHFMKKNCKKKKKNQASNLVLLNLATTTTTALTAIENKIPNVSNLVKKVTITQTLMKLKRKLLIIVMTDMLLLQNLIT